MTAKEAAGRKAAEFVEDGMIVGLGTGSTARWAIQAIGERVEQGLRIEAVATSVASQEQARELAIPLRDVDEVTRIDVTIDGADEVDADFNLIKGGGGALLREKIVASMTRMEIIVIDPSKLAPVLGAGFPLPVEVARFGNKTTARRIAELGCDPLLRTAEGRPFVTDNGNFIYDCRWPQGIQDAAEVERRLNQIPGVVENGLFIGLAHMVIIGKESGAAEVRRKPD